MINKPATVDRTLSELEVVIERGQKTFVEVGIALAEIKERKLYESEFDSFNDYCMTRWGWARSYCNYVIKAAETVKGLPEDSATIVVNESQAREVSKVPKEKRGKVIEKAASKAAEEDRDITAQDIKQAAEEEEPHIRTADEEMDGPTKLYQDAILALEYWECEYRSQVIKAGADQHVVDLLSKLYKMLE